MKNTIKIGIIICDRYKNCAGGKCLKSIKNRDGAFEMYKKEQDVELVGYTSCGGCPGGNIEYAPNEMIKNGAEVIHLATGLIVAYPPCPYTEYFKKFIELNYKIKVIIGTHPIPQKYYKVHNKLNTWDTTEQKNMIKPSLSIEKIRLQYD